MRTDYKIVIIGAGMAGLAMAARLKLAGETSFVVLEKADSIGGTWRDNTYPGAACDVQSHLYWFSFGEQPDWSRVYATQPEILRNIELFAEHHQLHEHIRFGTEVTTASWREEDRTWLVRTGTGDEIRTEVVVTAWGQLNQPSYGGLEGRETFAGLSVHTARWPEDLDLTGKRVACVGSGASAVQLVPAIAGQAGHLTVFQRSPNYLLPRMDRALGDEERQALRDDPAGYTSLRDSLYHERDRWAAGLSLESNPVREEFQQISLDHLAQQVPDPELRERLRPDYEFGCKRVLIADDYYPALLRDNVDLVDTAVERIEPEGVRTTDGRLHEVDVIAYATGFKSLLVAGGVEIAGRGGRSLRDAWREGPEAYLGTTISGFPNLFMLYGPNTNLGHHSILFMVESQIDYAVRAIEALAEHSAAAFDVRPEVMAEHNDRLQEQLTRTAFAGSCTSWYKTATGKVVNNWPGSIEDYRQATKDFTLADYEILRTP
ncbi:flavin-containing monooxygenase [Streptomyces griseocarneus]|uniref:flavin-containing monooxygenase n=1 Tax=Streptomyces griseocarneus TaxID=51201 RepID=UPI00199E17BA|nr:NAD(P)/FAD-dependent oxidoreductase [Streptomyces griseocarneus]MBZ6474777.1 NAD(P)/FAD-dependent oxidoreductase [Streptomyces griseocarneus]GHG48027.1 4-hydroxyacetophenone monooxygenase [Streptomyces griseocarneus]